MGNCIGERNQGLFVLFLLSLSFLTVITTATSFAVIAASLKSQEELYDHEHIEAINAGATSEWHRHSHVLLKVFKHLPVTFSFGCFTAACAWSLISLLYYHLQIISIGQTTNERVRAVYSHGDNPYDHGCASNWTRCVLRLCYPPPSRLPRDFSEIVQEGPNEVLESVWNGGDHIRVPSTADSQTSLVSSSG